MARTSLPQVPWSRATPGAAPRNLHRSWGKVVSDLIESAPTLLVAAIAALFHTLLYGLANRYPSGPAALLRETWLDRATPFWPWTAWIYASTHGLVLAASWLTRAPGARPRLVAVFAITVAISAFVHWAMPVRFPRELYPLAEGGAGAALLEWVRGVDRVVWVVADHPEAVRPGLIPGTSLAPPAGMWPALAYRCDACHGFTEVEARFVHPGRCTRCARPLELRGHAHLVHGQDAGEAIRESPVPVVLVFASQWKDAPDEEHRAVESLARALSGEVTVLVTDVAEDLTARSVWAKQGRPRAVLLSGGNEIGRGNDFPAEGPVRTAIARVLPRQPEEPLRAAA